MRELSVQAASDTNTNVDRNQIQAEIDQLREEIDRIARTTEFNTMKLLDGKIESFRPEADVKVVTGGNFDLQATTDLKGLELANFTGTIAANDSDGESFSLNLGGFNLGAVTVKFLDATAGGSGTIQIAFGGTDFEITVNTIADGKTVSSTIGDLKFEFALSGNETDGFKIDSSNVSLATSKGGDVPEGSYVVEVGQFKDEGTSPLDVRVNYFNDEGLVTSPIVDFSDGKAAVIGDDNVGMTVSDGEFIVSVDDKALLFTWDTDVYDINDFNNALPMEEVIDSGVVRAEERWYEDTSLVFQIGANEGQNMVAGLDDMRAAALGLTDASLKVTDQDSAERTVMVVDAAIHKVSSARAKIGAVQNRLEHTISNLGVASENLTAAESRIRDVDMAKEMMQYTKQQILMQSANAMLAQANTIPQNVLQLLR
jgi:flagellin